MQCKCGGDMYPKENKINFFKREVAKLTYHRCNGCGRNGWYALSTDLGIVAEGQKAVNQFDQMKAEYQRRREVARANETMKKYISDRD